MSCVRREVTSYRSDGCMPRYSGSQLFGVLIDGAELGESRLHDKQVL